MVLSLLYLAVRALLGALVRSRRGLDLKDVELLLLRHELEVLRREVRRPTLRPADRALLAAGRATYQDRRAPHACDAADAAALAWTPVRRKWRQASGRRSRPTL